MKKTKKLKITNIYKEISTLYLLVYIPTNDNFNKTLVYQSCK
jgi:hypothetical protein